MNLDRTLRKLQETQSKLIQSEKLAALGKLTAGIAHEINNPLNFISASLEEMSAFVKQHPDLFKSPSENNEENENISQYPELIQYAKEGVIRATDIVTKLGSLKSRTSQISIRTTLAPMIQSALLDLKVNIPSNIKLTTEIPDDLAVECRIQDIQQVIQSIITNGIDAISSLPETNNEQISISAYREIIEEKNYVTISISNSGPLIPQNEIHKLFDPFYTTKSQGEGIGLGLSVCFNIIQQHKGIINVENKGAQVLFKISLPEKQPK